MSGGLTDRHPRAKWLSRQFGRAMLAVSGWKIEGELPDESKVVFVAAPHTSNWDGIIMVAIAWKLGVRLSWLGKQSLFWWPLGPFLKAFGGIEVSARASQSFFIAQSGDLKCSSVELCATDQRFRGFRGAVHRFVEVFQRRCLTFVGTLSKDYLAHFRTGASVFDGLVGKSFQFVDEFLKHLSRLRRPV